MNEQAGTSLLRLRTAGVVTPALALALALGPVAPALAAPGDPLPSVDDPDASSAGQAEPDGEPSGPPVSSDETDAAVEESGVLAPPDKQEGGALPVEGPEITAPAPTAQPVAAQAPAAQKPPPRVPDTGVLGGYYDLSDAPDETPPRDGGASITTGAVLVPLGALGTGAGLIMMYTAEETRCAELYGASADTCRGLYSYGIASAVQGGLMLVTGAVFLGIGLTRRAKYRVWMRDHGLANATTSPLVLRGGVGLQLSLRF